MESKRTERLIDALDVGADTVSLIEFVTNSLTRRGDGQLDKSEMIGLASVLRMVSDNVEYICRTVDPDRDLQVT